MDDMFKELNNEYKAIELLKKEIEKDPSKLSEDDKSLEYIEEFEESAGKTITYVKNNIEQINKDYEDIIKLYGEKSGSFKFEDHFIPLMKSLKQKFNVFYLFHF